MKFITILLTVFALKSCDSSKAAVTTQNYEEVKQEETLSGTYKIFFLENNTELPEELSITFEEITNKVYGYSGCNNFTGEYSVKENIIKFGTLATTKKMCKRFMDVEQNMFKTMAEVTTFTLENGSLSLSNDKTVVLKANKDTDERIAQEDEYTIEYIASTRGFYTQVILKNGIMTIQKDRDHKAPIETIACSKDELEVLNTMLANIDLEKLSEYEGPTKKRLYDGAASAELKITRANNDYKTPHFDHGYPNSNIEAFVNTLTSMAKMPK